jgi:acetyl esterase/lipase
MRLASKTKSIQVIALLFLMAASLPLAVLAQQPAIPKAPNWVPLWPEGAPGSQGTAPADIPAVEIFLPAKNPTHTAIVICPGGGYVNLSIDKEGESYARWLNDRGVAGIVLRYRLGPKYHHPIEIGDAQRALRYVRVHSAEFNIDKDKVGIWGSSAGGHLASTAGTHFDAGNSAAPDAIDRESSRPDFMVLSYPVITFELPYAHTGSRDALLGKNADPKLVKLLSNEQQVTKDTPPAFLYHTTDDKTVPVMNSVMFYQALLSNGVSAEMHLYQHGPHGSGLAQSFPELRGWPDQLYHWLVANGWAQGS